MSKTTVEKVIDGLECKGTTGSNCKECQFCGNGEDCSVLAMKAAADLIRSQAARIDELEANLAAAEEKTGKAEAEADYAKDRLAQAIGEANQAKAEIKARVDAAPVVHAHWERYRDRTGVICSNCRSKWHLFVDEEYADIFARENKFCSNCGAKMDEETGE